MGSAENDSVCMPIQVLLATKTRQHSGYGLFTNSSPAKLVCLSPLALKGLWRTRRCVPFSDRRYPYAYRPCVAGSISKDVGDQLFLGWAMMSGGDPRSSSMGI